ncbi:44283_t:CDS:2, partial [Gigaspora margarita]
KLLEEDIVEKYDKPGRPLAAMIDPNLWNKIHKYVEFGIFADDTVIISQDDKTKVSLGISVVGRIFKTLQSINKPILVADHNFPVGSKMKLIHFVYLIIDLANSNDSLRLEQLLIFVRPEYFVGTLSLTHISDLQRSDENLKHIKNIIHYCNFFCKFDFDYLTIRTHAPGQSVYNPVECSIASLSEKLAGITLPVDNFGSHLDSQGKVLDKDLACRNFEFVGNHLCNIWRRDKIYSKPVPVKYVDQIRQPFAKFESSTSWEWIENHTQICRYLLDIKKCKESRYCSEYKAPDAALLLDQNNRFLSPIMKAKDQHYINPIHALQYYNKLKILIYDHCCPSILHEHSSISLNYGCSSQNSVVFNTAKDVLQSSPQAVIE